MKKGYESTMNVVTSNTQFAMRGRMSQPRRILGWIFGTILLLNSTAWGHGLNASSAGHLNLRETTMADEKQKEDPLEAEKRRTAMLEEKAKQAEAQKKIREAELSGVEVTPPEGKTEVDDKVKIEAEILTHEAMAEIAKTIAEDLRRSGITRITIHNEAVVNSMLAYRAFQSQIKGYVDRYDRLLARNIPSELVAAPSADMPMLFTVGIAEATAIAKSIIGLAALFRTDIKVIGVETSVKEEALVAELVRQLNSGSRRVEVFYPALFKPGVLARNAVSESQTLKTLEPLYVRVDSAKEMLAKLELALEFLKDKIGNPGLAEAELRRLQGQKAELLLLQERLAELNAEVKAFIAGLTEVDEKSGTDVFSQLIKAEGLIKLNDEERGGENYTLALRIEKSGGANVIKKNLFTHLFTGDRLTHTGGTIISYILFDQQGAIAASGTMYRNTPRTKNHRIGDNLARLPQGNEPVAQR